jgi:hypothetical protein
MREAARPAEALPEAPLARASAGTPEAGMREGEAAKMAARRVVGRRQEARVWTMAGRLPGALEALAASQSPGPLGPPEWRERPE